MKMDIEKLKNLMIENEIDVVISHSPENFFYSTGIDIFTQRIVRERLALSVFPLEGDPCVIVSDIEESLAKEVSRISDIEFYKEFEETPINLLARIMNERGLASSKVAMETSYLSLDVYHEIKKELP